MSYRSWGHFAQTVGFLAEHVLASDVSLLQSRYPLERLKVVAETFASVSFSEYVNFYSKLGNFEI